MRRLLRDVAEGRNLGDTTTLADASVVDEIQRKAPRGPAGGVTSRSHPPTCRADDTSRCHIATVANVAGSGEAAAAFDGRRRTSWRGRAGTPKATKNQPIALTPAIGA